MRGCGFIGSAHREAAAEGTAKLTSPSIALVMIVDISLFGYNESRCVKPMT